MATRAELLNAFVPSSSMDDPSRFSGRKKEIKELTDALQVSGSVPLIFGQRGLGKSSLAAQLSRIAQGDVELLEELDAMDLVIPESGRFITFYITCEDATADLAGLLSLMINAVDALKVEKAKEEKKSDYRLIDKKTTKGLSLKLFKHETVNTYKKIVNERDLTSLSLQEKLVSITETLTDVYRQPVLFVIDELDRLNRVEKFASFLKSNSSEILKFALVGIATTEGELLSDHASLDRQLKAVRIAPMTPDELESIVDQTESYLAEVGFTIKFTELAKQELARLAAGFPWFVHIIGQRALVDSHDQGRAEINTAHILRAVKQLAQGQMAQNYFDRYQKAIRDSAPREKVLRLFARWDEEYIPTSELYPLANSIGVAAPANYVGHLTKEECGFVLARAPQQARALYRFPDEMFKVYCRIRPALYEGVELEIEQAYRSR